MSALSPCAHFVPGGATALRASGIVKARDEASSRFIPGSPKGLRLWI
jgi:hypothetical protein